MDPKNGFGDDFGSHFKGKIGTWNFNFYSHNLENRRTF